MSSSSAQTLNLKPVSSPPAPAKHPLPSSSKIVGAHPPWNFSYVSSKDGKEANLLILLHGLGDTKEPFFKLGQQLNLPATCVLSLEGQTPVPFMDGPSWCWYPVFSPSFPHLPLSNPSPYPPMDNLCRLLRYLTSKDQEGCGWDLEQIHLFGWGMGGTMALELARWIGVKGLGGSKESEDKTTKGPCRLGSAISICGPLISTPAVSSGTLDIPTPVFYFHRPRISGSTPPSVLTKTFTTVRYATGRREAKRVNEDTGEDEGMLTGQDEWRQVMKFWSEVLGRGDEGWKGRGEVYEVVR